MSMKTLPLLFINLGGEMMYILDQRLKAQNIPEVKAKKVIHDITGTMFNRRFMDEIFQPQCLYSKKALRTVFDRLAHASIMRLNSASMDKLYDLMTMAFKHQVSLSVHPMDILLVTLNHMDAIREFVRGNAPVSAQVNYVFELLITHYASLASGEWMLIRQTLLNFFQDVHIRVSIFLKNKVQSSNGRFVLPTSGPVINNAEVPGSIRLFQDSEELRQVRSFSPGNKFGPPQREGSKSITGDRVIKLGTNMYSVSHRLEATPSELPKSVPMSEIESSGPNPLAKAQLDLLSKLIGSSSEKKTSKPEFRLNLFNNDEEEEQAAATHPSSEGPTSQFINIDASKKKGNAELSRIMGELKVNDSESANSDDLLDLMDSAE